MNKNQDQLTQARSLRANIAAAPDVWLPRRETLLTWLDGFVGRAGKANYEVEGSEADDLRALDLFLRKHKVPAL